ncbi:MAG: hypothetical protein R3337_00160 [Gammaproteobacteria bacterium]|nr:hypothetical protein [Gammaproteobacteria bacterium]
MTDGSSVERRPGRPPLPPGKAATSWLKVRVTASELEHYRSAAEERGESLSDGVREALKDRYGPVA